MILLCPFMSVCPLWPYFSPTVFKTVDVTLHDKKKVKNNVESEKQNNFCTWSRILHPFNGCCLCREKMAWRHFSSSTHGMVVHGWGVVLQVCIYWPLTLEATREIALGQFLFSCLNHHLEPKSQLFMTFHKHKPQRKWNKNISNV